MVFQRCMETPSLSSRAPFSLAAASFRLPHLLSGQSKILLGSWDRHLRTQRSLHTLACRTDSTCTPGKGREVQFQPPLPHPGFSTIPLGEVLNAAEIRALLPVHVSQRSCLLYPWCEDRGLRGGVQGCWQGTRQVNHKAQQLSGLGDTEVPQ